jgi:hypothetical protein
LCCINIVLNSPAGNEKVVAAEPVIIALEAIQRNRISRNQQDSQEFLHLIHESLALEETRFKKLFPDTQFPENPFEGAYSTSIMCGTCGWESPWKREKFTELPLIVPQKVFLAGKG